MARLNGFKRGSGCFTCHVCKKLTRDVNRGNGGLGLCPLCQAKSECGNSLSDHGFPGDAWGVFDDCKSCHECDLLLTAELEKLHAAKV